MERLLATLREAELEYELSQMKLRIQQLEQEKAPWDIGLLAPKSVEPVCVPNNTILLQIAAETKLSYHPRYGKVLEARSFVENEQPFIRLYREMTGQIPRHQQLEMINHTLVDFQKILSREYRNKELL